MGVAIDPGWQGVVGDRGHLKGIKTNVKSPLETIQMTHLAINHPTIASHE